MTDFEINADDADHSVIVIYLVSGAKRDARQDLFHAVIHTNSFAHPKGVYLQINSFISRYLSVSKKPSNAMLARADVLVFVQGKPK